MGLLDRIAEKVAAEIVKNPTLPVGAVAMTETQMRNAAIANQTTYGQSVALERNPNSGSVPFAPGIPIVPGAINPPRTDGRPDPRRYEFQVAQNINITETRLVPFATLRAAADGIDILRRCIEVSKAKLSGIKWDFVLAEDASEKITAEIGGSHVRAQQEARDRYTKDIDRARQFWEMPDRANGMSFNDWLNVALEDVLVLDAWAVWPQKTVGNDLYGLQILDAATIKPLIDDRGMRPAPPYSAYQQILFGFPRSEFSAPNETEDADGEFTSDELSYMVRNRRTWTIYGFGPVERALSLADIYLRRQQWIRAEYTDGVTPELMMKTDANFGNNPDLLRAYENIFNNDLAGQTAQRMRVRLLPIGMEPIQFDGYGEKFKDTLDDYLVNSICGHFGVMPSEIGFSPKGGLGGAGFQAGEAQSSDVIGTMPLANWMERMISQLSYNYLGIPRELEFKFMPSGRDDNESIARTRDIEIRNGGLTINEMRSLAGRPLIESAEADMPILVMGASAYVVTEEGIMPFGDTMGNAEMLVPELDALGNPIESPNVIADPTNEIGAQEPIVKPSTDAEVQGASPELVNSQGEDDEEKDNAKQDDEEDTAKAAQDEIRRFLRWIRKSPDRSFNFQAVPVVYADVLNKFVETKDYDSARWYAERYLA
jgi:hypothetical protein